MTLSSNEIMERLYDEFGTDLSGIDECDAGICYNCGTIQEDGVEPDAREYFCDACGEYEVHGIEDAVITHGG